jgi:hypothetical protein
MLVEILLIIPVYRKMKEFVVNKPFFKKSVGLIGEQ